MDDNALAALLAYEAGASLLAIQRAGMADETDSRELKDRGDSESQHLLARLLHEHRPDDAVLSEEAPDDPVRLTAERVWIIDPLDGTREFSEGRQDWAVHVALWSKGDLTAGAVALPGLDRVLSAVDPALAWEPPSRVRLAVSRTRATPLVDALAKAMEAEVIPMGSAGYKVAAVVRGEVDAYVHSGGQYEWDSAAPVAVARAAGLFASRIDGSPLRYNGTSPYLPDLVVCNPSLSQAVLLRIEELIEGGLK